MTTNDKVDFRQLPEPDMEEAGDGVAFVGPRNTFEEILMDLFCGVLSISRVSIHQSFFEAGGHSLLATQLVSRISAAFPGVQISLSRVFDTPTIAGLAAAVESLCAGGDAPTGSIKQMIEQSLAPSSHKEHQSGRHPLSYNQESLLLVWNLDRSSSAYNVVFTMKIISPVQPDAMKQAAEVLQERHAVLRTTYCVNGPVQYQEIRSCDEMPVSFHDVDATEWDAAAVQRYLVEEGHCSFDLENGPLFRLHLVKTAEGHTIFMLTMHHIAVDGWSVALLVSQLADLYQHFVQATPDAPLPTVPQPVVYSQYASWQRMQMDSPSIEHLEAYWIRQLTLPLPVINIPMDRPRPAVQTTAGVSSVALLPPINCPLWLQEACLVSKSMTNLQLGSAR